LLWSKILTNM